MRVLIAQNLFALVAAGLSVYAGMHNCPWIAFGMFFLAMALAVSPDEKG